MVEDEPRAAAAQAARREQQEVGRVARVDDVEVLRARERAHELPDPPHRLRVLAQVADGAAVGGPQREAVDLDPLEHLVGLGVTRSAPCGA